MKRSNVLILFTDQLSRNMLGCYGGTELETPCIDSLAKEGCIFNNYYTPSAVCTPSRAMFMTGNYPHHNGAYKNHLPIHDNQKGFANFFSNAGYKTGYLGKWHLSTYSTKTNPIFETFNALGFEDYLYKVEFGHAKKVVETNDGQLALSREIGDENSYTTDWLAHKTMEYIKAQTEPFLFMVSMPDPHQPYKVRAPYDTMFSPDDVQLPTSFAQTTLPDWAENDRWGRNIYYKIEDADREASFRNTKAQYLGELKCIDDNVGKIIQFLKKENLYDNTTIIFTTDHGDYMGEHGLLEKNNLYDSVYQLPLIIKPAKGISVKQTVEPFINILDFPKTLCALAGVNCDTMTCDGENRMDILTGKDTATTEEIYIHPSDVPRTGIITREYELAYVGKSFDGQTMFKEHILFDRIHDVDQMNNLFFQPQYQSIIKTLTEKIQQHHKKVQTPLERLPKEAWYEKA